MRAVSLKRYLVLVLMGMLGLASCATTPRELVATPMELRPFGGEMVDRERLWQSYVSILSAESKGEIVIRPADVPLLSIYPSVTFERGGLGIRTVVTIDIKHAYNGRWVARRSYSHTPLMGSESRDAIVEVLLKKSVPFVQATLRKYNGT